METKLNKYATWIFLISTISFLSFKFLFTFIFNISTTTNIVKAGVISLILYIILLLPILIFLKNDNMSEIFKFKLLSFKQFISCICLFICTYFMNIFLSIVSLLIVKLLNYNYSKETTLVINTIPQLLTALFIIGILPAFFEELIFRGFLLSSYKKYKFLYGLICTSFCFALLHFNVCSFLSIFYIGIILYLVVYYTESILGGMIIHFCNNSIGLILGYIASSTIKTNTAPVNITVNDIIIQLIPCGILASISLIITYIIIKKLRLNWKKNNNNEITNINNISIFNNLPIVIICIIYILIVFI